MINLIAQFRSQLKKKLPEKISLPLLAWKHKIFGEKELRYLKHYVAPGRQSIDVGANWGSYTYFLSKYSSYVIAFEPNPEPCKFLEKAVPDNVAVYQYACSDSDEEILLGYPVIDKQKIDGRGTIEKHQWDENYSTISIKCCKLDEYIERNIGFIKIDVEGHELNVIRGGERLLIKWKPTLQVEIEQRHLKFPMYVVFQKLQELGYLGFFYFEGKLTNLAEFIPDFHQDPLTADSAPNNYINNFYFIHGDNINQLKVF